MPRQFRPSRPTDRPYVCHTRDRPVARLASIKKIPNLFWGGEIFSLTGTGTKLRPKMLKTAARRAETRGPKGRERGWGSWGGAACPLHAVGYPPFRGLQGERCTLPQCQWAILAEYIIKFSKICCSAVCWRWLMNSSSVNIGLEWAHSL